MIDNRVPLPEGTDLLLGESRFRIFDVIGRGGSCIAYSAAREPNVYEQTIGMPPTPAVIKEFYPADLHESINRKGIELYISHEAENKFDGIRRRFEHGAVNQARFSIKDSDHSFAPTRIVPANNTIYSIVDSVRGDILENIRAELDLHEIAQVFQSLCYAVKELHDDGKLHLDIKPSNIFLFNKDSCESCRIALFDFDTVILISDISTAIIPYSNGWSPYEQEHEHRGKISFATDIYAIGAVLYWLITGKKVADETLDDIKRQKYVFMDDSPLLANKASPRDPLLKIFAATLKREPSERAKRIEELL